MPNSLTNLRAYAARKGVTANVLNEVDTWRQLARVAGVNSYGNLTELDSMRAMLAKSNVYAYGEHDCLMALCAIENCAPVEWMNEDQLLQVLADPAQFLFNQQSASPVDSYGILTETGDQLLTEAGDNLEFEH